MTKTGLAQSGKSNHSALGEQLNIICINRQNVQDLQTRIERSQPREQAGFRQGYSTTDHLLALNQIKEKSNGCNFPLCRGFIDFEKAFDTVGHFAIFEALRKTNINEIYIPFYKTLTAKLQQGSI